MCKLLWCKIIPVSYLLTSIYPCLKSFFCNITGKLQFNVTSQAASSSRRHVLVCSASFFAIQNLNCISMPFPVRAEEESNDQEEKDGVVGAIKSLFDPNETTKSGKLLPKAYLKSAREVVKTLRESLKEDPKDIAKFRRTADAAKESIREYLGSWRGQEKVMHEVWMDFLMTCWNSQDCFLSVIDL